ncbi:TolC family protein [Marinomonas sp. M1K-6]|uniref:TolC family protein n=1 Tax=Marinomonas profundi TaxID=2726122 RepID=A0A847R2B9_9GAMM|nr:TolC family protein [Marinomonas profundi]NLQ17932.1 TolC family protein [Marinomonas profundi]UDV03414.1 TolC family protein [Marinomonas profundi]
MAVRPVFAKTLLAVLTAAAVAGCSVSPSRLSDNDVMANAVENRALLAEDFAPITQPIDLNEAFARTIKHNRDARLKAFEAVVSQGQLAVDQFDMLPELAARAGYAYRNNYGASASARFVDDEPAELGDYSVSSDKSSFTGSVGATWDVLDFGLSYFRAKQQADRFLISKERERKVVHTIMQQARNAYYRAVSAERLLAKIDPLIIKSRAALADSVRIEQMRAQSPMDALTYQRALLESLRTLQDLRKDLTPAKAELATLMGLNPAESFELADVNAPDFMVPEMNLDIDTMERTALVRRPELMEAQYQERITKEEVSSTFLTLFPNLSLNAGLYYDGSDYLRNNDWTSAGLGVNWNLMNVFRYGKIEQLNTLKMAATKQQALAVSMAVVSQVHIANIEYSEAHQSYDFAIDYLDVANRIQEQIQSSQATQSVGELPVIREELNTLLAELRRDVAYADLQNSFGKILVSMGLDPLPNGFGGMTLAELASAFDSMFERWSQGQVETVSEEQMQSAYLAKETTEQEE